MSTTSAWSTDEEKLARYLELHKATISGDWTAAKRICEEDPDSLTTPVDASEVTVLHLAAASVGDKSTTFFERLADWMVQEGLSLRATDAGGRNALHYAAQAGNTKAVELLAERDPDLTKQLDQSGESPLHIAALAGNEETVRYLLPATLRLAPSLFAGENGVGLLNTLIMDAFYDLAIELLEQNPGLAVERSYRGVTALEALARKPEAFPSGGRLSFWERFLINAWEKLSAENRNSPQKKDIEDPAVLISKIRGKTFPAFGILEKFQSDKIKYEQVLRLLRSLAEKAKSKQASSIMEEAALIAAQTGIPEIVEQIFEAYPNLRTWKYLTAGFDQWGNSILHLAAKFGYSAPSDNIPGAALQMQRELQWFQAVERLVYPSYKLAKNVEIKDAEMLFIESHKELVKEGELWMKDTANSFTTAAALVIAIAFAAALTIPGGNNGQNGLPIFLNDTSFMVFSIANTLALFSSAASLLIYLGMLTSRYSPEQFSKSLPLKLAVGQITLFFAIASMVVAFAAAVNIVLSHRVAWIGVPIGFLACFPLSLFVILHFPSLVQILYSIMGSSIHMEPARKKLF